MRRIAFTFAQIILLGSLTAQASAQLFGPSVEADPDKVYFLTPKDGPWLIYVASYSGDESAKMARDFVLEIRQDYKLNAYMYSRSEEERAQRDRELERMRKEYGDAPLKKYRIVDEYAVLIGNYKTMDAASGDLERIKSLKPPRSVPKPTAIMARKNRPDDKIFKKAKQGEINPFSHALVVRNPMVPREQAVRPAEKEEGEEDGLLLQLNSNEKHSLVKCPKPWTLVVSFGHGASLMQSAEHKPSVFDRLNPWADSASDRMLRMSARTSGMDLQKAARDASQLVDMLRDPSLGYEAYVLHTRTSSIVTVGGFSGANDPELLKAARQLAGLKVGSHKLLEQPVPMQVPRPQSAAR